MYECLNCGKEVEIEQVRERVRCPYCGYRILRKTRPESPVTVEAR